MTVRPAVYTLAVMLALCSMPVYAAQPTLAELTQKLDRATSASDAVRELPAIEKLVADCRKPACEPSEAGAQLARAYYLAGEDDQDKARKKTFMQRAIDSSAVALKAAPTNAHALYWRSMAQLQMADIVGGMSALGLVKDALKGLEKVATVEPGYDFAGAYRSRGKVLIEAPGWAFIGDKKKGLELLKKAKELFPATLINRLYLAQAYVKNGMEKDAAAELRYILSVRSGGGPSDAGIKREAGKLLAEVEG